MAAQYKEVDHAPTADAEPPAPITNRELLLLLLLPTFSAISFFVGALWQFIAHTHSHGITDGKGVCENARMCTAYGLRSQCGAWRD